MIEVPNQMDDGWTECPRCGAVADVLPLMESESDWTCLTCDWEGDGPEPRKVDGTFTVKKWREIASNSDASRRES
jgi:rubredoxin